MVTDTAAANITQTNTAVITVQHTAAGRNSNTEIRYKPISQEMGFVGCAEKMKIECFYQNNNSTIVEHHRKMI